MWNNAVLTDPLRRTYRSHSIYRSHMQDCDPKSFFKFYFHSSSFTQMGILDQPIEST